MALIFTTTSVALSGAAGAPFTITHALGTSPDFVYITPRGTTATTPIMVGASTTQIVTVTGVFNTGALVDVEVVKHHSIIY